MLATVQIIGLTCLQLFREKDGVGQKWPTCGMSRGNYALCLHRSGWKKYGRCAFKAAN